MWGLYLDPNEGANVGGGAGQPRPGDAFFGAPPHPGEVLIGPGGEVAVGAGVNAAWFARRVAQGPAHLANMVPNFPAHIRRPVAPVVPRNLFFPEALRLPNQVPGNAVPPPPVHIPGLPMPPPQQPGMAQARQGLFADQLNQVFAIRR